MITRVEITLQQLKTSLGLILRDSLLTLIALVEVCISNSIESGIDRRVTRRSMWLGIWATRQTWWYEIHCCKCIGRLLNSLYLFCSADRPQTVHPLHFRNQTFYILCSKGRGPVFQLAWYVCSCRSDMYMEKDPCRKISPRELQRELHWSLRI